MYGCTGTFKLEPSVGYFYLGLLPTLKPASMA